MNEQSEQALAELLQKMVSATEFAEGELPGLAEEILRFGFYSSLFWFVISVAYLSLLAWYVYRVKVGKSEGLDEHSGTSIVIVMVAGFAAFFAVVAACLYGHYLMQIIAAPKLYLVEYITSALSSK